MPKVILISSEDEKFPVEALVVEKSTLIKNMVIYFYPNGLNEDIEAPVPQVPAVVLRKVLQWCDHHKNTEAYVDDNFHDIQEWDVSFFGNDHDMTCEIVRAANYLDIEPLKMLGCHVIAKTLRGCSVKEMRKIFKVEDSFTQQEEEEFLNKNPFDNI